MPASRRTRNRSATNSDDPDKDEHYQIKRKKNNEAVRKTRKKTKETANARKKHVENLRLENAQLEAKIKLKEDHVKLLKDLLLTNVKKEDQDKMIQDILNNDSDNNNDNDNDNGNGNESSAE